MLRGRNLRLRLRSLLLDSLLLHVALRGALVRALLAERVQLRQRARVQIVDLDLQLLLVIAGRPNVLLLDEPTNDLDLDTLRVLEDFLDTWPGALVVVSHDRTFLEMTTERLVAVGSDGTVAAVPGGVAGWVSRLDLGDGNRRRSGALPTPRPAPLSPAPATSPKAAPVGRQLRQAEKELTRLQRQRDKITDALTATADYVELTRLGRELSAAQAALGEAEEVWLALAEEAESDD